MKEIKYNGYTISTFVCVFDDDDHIVDEFDDMKSAKASFYAKQPDVYKFKYAAAEQINADGDCNPAVFADTLKEAVRKLKKLLRNV